jgi:predicted ATPase
MGVQLEQDPVPPPDTAAPLRVRTLGGFCVWHAGQAVPAGRWKRRKAGDLFKALLGSPTYALPRDHLEDILWPDADPGAAARNLYGTLFSLRQLLGEAAVIIHLDGDMVRLAAPDDAAWLDSAAFESLARAALTGHDVEACRAALALYAGDYLPDDPYEDWAISRREVLRGYYDTLLLQLADLCGAQGELQEAESCLRTILAGDSCHEEATARLMGLLAAGGRRTEALKVYEQLHLALGRAFGVTPSRDVVALRSRLLAPSTPMAASMPSQPKLPVRPTNLPTALTSFVGRTREQAEVCALLAEARLLTLTGAGGTGKTRLALQTARALVDCYADGAWLVELAALAPGDANTAPVPQAVASVVGVREEPGELLTATLAAFLAPRHLLLILDNCEHLLGPCAGLAASLLAACPRLGILATSREPLGVPGEVLYPLSPLAVPRTGMQAEDLFSNEAAALFLTRARACRPGFSATPANAAAIVQICTQLDGIPLAIELAAARVTMLPVEMIADRLHNCLQLLTGGPRTALPRQRTLRATLDWSYALLAQPERALLRRLAVFAGSWTLDAAEAVAHDDEPAVVTAGSLDSAPASMPDLGPRAPRLLSSPDAPNLAQGDVLELLSGLVAKSLVRVEERSGDARYRFLEPVRQYARQAVEEAGELALLRDRQLQWCVQLAERAEPHLRGGPEQQTWLGRLEAEHDNCRAALRWALEQSRLGQGLRLAGALWRFWNIRGYDREGSNWLEALLRVEAVDLASTAAARANALYAAAAFAHALGSYERATQRADAARSLFRQLEDRPGVAKTEHLLGMLALDSGDPNSAEELFAGELLFYRAAGLTQRLATVLMNLGVVASVRGHYERAMQYYEEAADLFRSLGDTVYVARTLANMGEAALRLDDDSRGSALYEESLRHARQCGSIVDTANALGGLADVARRSGQHERAVTFLRESVSLFLQCGEYRQLTFKLAALAESLAGIGRFESAACAAGAVMARCEASSMRLPEYERTAFERAIDDLQQALSNVRYDAAFAKGRDLTEDQIVALCEGCCVASEV